MKMKSTQQQFRIEAESGERLGGCDRREVVAQLARHGLVTFAGFEPTLEEFESFTGGFGTCQETRTVHYPPGGVALGFHAEDCYNPFRPDALWLWCVACGSGGGAPTGVVDGVRLLETLSAEWRDFCQKNRLRFERQWAAETWEKEAGRDGTAALDAVLKSIPRIDYGFLQDGTLYVRYDAPFISKTPAGEDSFTNTMLHAITEPSFYGMTVAATGEKVPDALLQEVHDLAVAQEIPAGGGSGDVILIDNYRMLHRRAKYAGEGRDMRARHCEDFYGSPVWEAGSALALWTKRLLQGDEDYPIRVGPARPEHMLQPFGGDCASITRDRA
jgi:hypothetical protein